MKIRFHSLMIRFGCLLLALLMLAGCTGDKGGDSSSKGDSSSAITSSNAGTAVDADVSDINWQAVGMVSDQMLQAGVKPGEGCQWLLSVTYSYSNPDICWMGTDVGGIYRSTDGGKNWEPSTVGLTSAGGRGIAVDPTNSDRVLVVGGNGTAKDCDGLFLSTDGGDTFERVQASRVHGWRDNRVQIAYDYSSYDKKLGYCTTVYWSRETLKYEVSSYTGYKGGAENSPALFKSTDGGKTWELVNNSADIGGAQLATDAKTGALFAAGKNGLFKSTDGGKSFKQVISKLTVSVSTVITKPGHVWATCQDGLYYSTNGGDSFSKINSAGYPTNLYPNVTVSPADPNYMIVCADEKTWLMNWGKTCKYFYSHDGGKTFTECEEDRSLAFFRQNNQQGGVALHPTDKNKSMIIGGSCTMISTNAGKTYVPNSQGYAGSCWTSISFNVNNPNLIALSNQDKTGAFTTDGGKTWKSVCYVRTRLTDFCYGGYVLDENTVFFIARDDSGLYKQGKGAYVLMRSTDGGVTFTSCGVAFKENTYMTGAVGNQKVVFAGNMRSADSGNTWQKMEGVDKVLAVDYKTKAIYGIRKGYLVKSTDEGLTWKDVCRVSPDLEIEDLSVAADGSVWLVNDLCTYKVTDGKCKPMGSVSDYGEINTIACDPNNADVLYVGCNYYTESERGGVFRSTDGGESWHLINKTADNGVKGLDGVSGSGLMRCHPKTGELYTIGSCRGLWKLAPYVKK